jgi:hypothetical protein
MYIDLVFTNCLLETQLKNALSFRCRLSVRVLHSGRRWYYQPQAIISERSGLIESSVVWFLSGMLRLHGYDHTTLSSIVGKPVTPLSWRIGDIVAPKVASNQSKSSATSSDSQTLMIGRVVAETSNAQSPPVASHSRQSGTVVVEFVSRAFADAVGIKSPGLLQGKSLETRRIRTSKLVHTTELHGSRLCIQPFSRNAKNDTFVVPMDPDLTPNISSPTAELGSTIVNEKMASDIEGLRCLDRSAIHSLAKECRKSSDTLASMFSAGLPDAIMFAISAVERLMNSLEPKDDLPSNLAALGSLANAIAEQLYGNARRTLESDDMEAELTVSQRATPWQNMPRNGRNHEHMQLRSNSHLLRVDERRGESQGLASSLQHRHNVLLSLMSRASRGSGAGPFANDATEVGIESFGQLPPALAQMREIPPFAFGASSDMIDYDDHMLAYVESPQNPLDPTTMDDDDNSTHANETAIATVNYKVSFLDTILRCHGSVSSAPLSGSVKQGGAAYAVFIRHLVRCGILFDSVEWTDALVHGHCKSVQLGAQSKGSAILRGVVDEEGTPLLMLAITLGCSGDLVAQLIKNGASVGNEAIVKAAMSNQPTVLSVLLQSTSYKVGSIDLELCSPEVRRLLFVTKTRQDDLSKKMADAAGNFMVRLLEKLLEVGLSSRQFRTTRIDMCSKVICEMLVGNVLLRALQVSQKAPLDPSQSEQGTNHEMTEQNDKVSSKDKWCDSTNLPLGLLGALPRFVLLEFFFSEVDRLTKYLLLCEDYLCSKEMADVASGLTFLSMLLTKFPQLRSSSEIERFGISEFVANHNVLSSNRIADILSKQLNIGLDVSSNPSGTGDESRYRSVPTITGGCVVLCPKKHHAVLHITRHSSFRCDICGSAVPKGEYIFGCRQCDYDECLHCTLRDEKRTLGVQMMIRELASDCHRMLTEEDTERKSIVDGDVAVEPIASDELRALSIRLLQRDLLAIKDLGALLTLPGRITVHEFLTGILPSLHACLIGHSYGGDGVLAHGGTAHRSKKARASSRSSYDGSPDSRHEYCREALRYMISDRTERAINCSVAEDDSSAKLSDVSSIEVKNGKQNEDDKSKKVNISYSAGASEMLRRLHQILSFYESVQGFSALPKKTSGPNLTLSPDDLQSLTKPVELMISPSPFDASEATASKSRSVVYAEPLIPFADLQLHVLRTYRVKDATYVSFCRR